MKFAGMLFCAAMTAMTPVTAAEPPRLSATVVGRHSVTHPADKLTVTLPRSAVLAGSERFVLFGTADAEIHVFVESDAHRRVRRLYWIQFEHYLPSRPDLKYDYAEGNRHMTAGRLRVWVRANAYGLSEPTREGSDREHVFGIVKRAGFKLPAEMANVRIIHLPDDRLDQGVGRKELMVIYTEDLALSRVKLASLSVGDEPTARWNALEPLLVKRALNSVSISRR